MTDTNDAPTSRRNYLRAAGAVGLAGVTGLAGCQDGGGSATGTLATAVKDAPGDISDFERCVVTIGGFWLKTVGGDGDDATAATDEGGTPASDDQGTPATDEEGVVQQAEGDVDQSDGREYHEYDEPQEADLVQLQGGDSALIDEREVAVGTYAYLQLDVSGVEATLADGGDAEVSTPGKAPLQFKEQFEVREGQRTTFTADFTPVKRGRTARYVLQPVAKGTEVSYSDVATSE